MLRDYGKLKKMEKNIFEEISINNGKFSNFYFTKKYGGTNEDDINVDICLINLIKKGVIKQGENRKLFLRKIVGE